jgi:hypothetical protein
MADREPVWLHFTPHEIAGPLVLPPSETGSTPSSWGPSLADATGRGQYRGDRVYVLDSRGLHVRTFLGSYQFSSGPGINVYEVEPIGPLEADPDPSMRDHYFTSRCCRSARVVRQVWPEQT